MTAEGAQGTTLPPVVLLRQGDCGHSDIGAASSHPKPDAKDTHKDGANAEPHLPPASEDLQVQLIWVGIMKRNTGNLTHVPGGHSSLCPHLDGGTTAVFMLMCTRDRDGTASLLILHLVSSSEAGTALASPNE